MRCSLIYHGTKLFSALFTGTSLRCEEGEETPRRRWVAMGLLAGESAEQMGRGLNLPSKSEVECWAAASAERASVQLMSTYPA